VRERVIAEVDHKNLNLDVAWMSGVIPTTERFAEKIWDRLTQVLATAAPKVRLAELVLHETDNNRVRLTGNA
jgi:6-pyruvoyltetrahydropterin/6-carboxytetrahydropterin synthase